MTSTITDPSLYRQFEDEQLMGINGSFVNELLRAGTDEWQTHSDATPGRFETTGNEQEPLKFAGIHIIESDNMHHIDRDFYMSKIEQITFNGEFSKFASMRMELRWLVNTRPDIVLEVSEISQVIRAIYEKDISIHCKRFNKAIKYVHDRNVSIRISKLDINSLRITAYNDATYSSNADLLP